MAHCYTKLFVACPCPLRPDLHHISCLLKLQFTMWALKLLITTNWTRDGLHCIPPVDQDIVSTYCFSEFSLLRVRNVWTTGEDKVLGQKLPTEVENIFPFWMGLKHTWASLYWTNFPVERKQIIKYGEQIHSHLFPLSTWNEVTELYIVQIYRCSVINPYAQQCGRC